MEILTKTVTVPGKTGIEAKIHEEISSLTEKGFKIVGIHSVDEKAAGIEGLAAVINYFQPVEEVKAESEEVKGKKPPSKK